MKKFERNQKGQFTTKERSRQPKPIPPDPAVLNVMRARRAAVALAEFQRQTGVEVADVVSALLAGLMHWCDKCGQEFREELRRARNRYETETGETSAAIALHSEEL